MLNIILIILNIITFIFALEMFIQNRMLKSDLVNKYMEKEYDQR